MLTQLSRRLAYLSISDEQYIEKLNDLISIYEEKILSLEIKCDSLQLELKLKEELQERNELIACVPLWTLNGDSE